MSAHPTVVSLFSGAGGLDIGLERAGWRTATATDVDRDAITTLRASQSAAIPVQEDDTRHYLDGTQIIEADVRELSGRDLRPKGVRREWRPSLLAGGPPCQPWSSAGLQQGFRDPRGLLLGQMLRLADDLRPRYVVMENVRGLLTARGHRGEHGEAIRLIQSEWENLGYAVSWALMNAADYGAAQRRVRLVMVGSSDHNLPPFPEPTHGATPSLLRKPWGSLGDFLADRVEPAAHEIVRPTGTRAKELRQLNPGTGIRAGGTVEPQRPGGHWGYRQDCFLADLDLPSRTIRAASTPDWVRLSGQPMRRLTWRECAALQGFPDGWMFEGTRESKFRLIGNAVQTDVARALGGAVMSSLRKGRARSKPVSPEWPPYFLRRIRGARADHRANSASRRRHLEAKAS